MRFQIIEAEQRSEEWFSIRAGRATGSRACDIVAKIKTGEAAARRDYRIQLAVERLTLLPQEDGYISKEMQRGIDLEPTAFATYEAFSGNIARRTGFISMPEYMAGCSLDGDVDNFVGLIEVKCPKSATHIAYLKSQRIPPDYVPQITHNLWVTGAKWCDFVSFDDRLPEGLQFFCIRMNRDDAAIKAYEAELLRFLSEVDAEVESLTQLKAAA